MDGQMEARLKLNIHQELLNCTGRYLQKRLLNVQLMTPVYLLHQWHHSQRKYLMDFLMPTPVTLQKKFQQKKANFCVTCITESLCNNFKEETSCCEENWKDRWTRCQNAYKKPSEDLYEQKPEEHPAPVASLNSNPPLVDSSFASRFEYAEIVPTTDKSAGGHSNLATLLHQSRRAFFPNLVWTVDIRKRVQTQKFRLRKVMRQGKSSAMRNPFHLLSSLEMKAELLISKFMLPFKSSQVQMPFQVPIFLDMVLMILLLTFLQVTLLTDYHSS